MPEDIIQTIPLPSGWQIQTHGKTHIAGGYVHFADPEGEIQTRLLAEDFAREPKKSAMEFLGAFETFCSNLGTAPTMAFEVADQVFVGGSDEELWITFQHPVEREIAYDEDAEVIYYHIEEWKADPETVIGAFLMILKETIEDDAEEEIVEN